MGVGVAGLQAIATARRLGAQVSATDVRSATKEQITVARRQADLRREGRRASRARARAAMRPRCRDEYKAAQAELVSGHIAKQDIVITTALIPGRPAPRLISDAQVATMRPGSVIVDLAVEQGGNVEGAVAGEVVERHGVKIVGHRNVPSPPRRRRLGAVRAQPLQLPLRLLGQGSGQAGAAGRRRDRRGRPADAGRAGREREAAGVMAAAPILPGTGRGPREARWRARA